MKSDGSLVLSGDCGNATVFAGEEGTLRPVRLCGMLLSRHEKDYGPVSTQGVAVMNIDGQRYEGGALAHDSVEKSVGNVTCRWRVGDTALLLSAAWRGCPDTGIVSRRDTIQNNGDKPVTLSRCLARIVLPRGRYECYTQTSRWCHENQGGWEHLHSGLTLKHLPGRTTEGGTPYLAIRPVGSEHGLVFHILPRGNWTIHVSSVPSGGDLPFAVVELGLADDNLHMILEPGKTFTLPEILFQPLDGGELCSSAPDLHRHLLANHFRDTNPEAPVVFNTWFDQFEILDVPRLRDQLAAAKEAGCEIFVIDAGWYGAGGPNWGRQTGDWREKTESAFCGHMREFADEVRAAGLGFGLWMEPERFGPDAPIRAEHPDWFIPIGGNARIDLSRLESRAWLRGEIGRLVETYQLAWMKIDFNFALDIDASGAELADYTDAWYRMLDEIRVAYPGTFFEGCSSGAMRGDLETLRHFDSHFLSDSTNPTDMLRITQGAWLRLPPGRLTRWCVVRSAGQVLPRYGKRVAESPATILVPGGALWEPSESADLDFALWVAMPGMFGLSGDLAGLSAEQRERIAALVAFYKRWRRFITGAVGHLLTPPLPLECREGWIGLQLQSPADDTSLVFIYRLGNAGAPPALKLRCLDPARAYRVESGFTGDCLHHFTGQALMRDGLPPERLAPGNNSAQVFVVSK